LKILKLVNSQHIKIAAIGGVGVKFLSALFALLNGILLTHLLSVKDFGIYILAFTSINIITIPVSLGLPSLITRYVSKYIVTNNKPAIKGLLIRSNQLVLITYFVTLIIAFFSYLLWWKSYSENVVETFWYALMLLPILVFGSLRSATLRGLKFIILGQMPETLLRNFFFCGLLVTVYLSDIKLAPQNAMIYHSIAALIAFIIGYVFLKKKLLNQLKNVQPIFKNKFWLKEAIPYSITSGTKAIKSKLLIYVLALFGAIEAIAIFDIAMRGAKLVSYTSGALNTAISPYLSSLFEGKQKVTLQRVVTKTSLIVSFFSFPVAIVFILFGKPILNMFFGENYIISYIPLVILCIGQLINAVAGPTGELLNMTGNQKYFSKNQFQMMIIGAVISVPLIYYYDVIGAAIVFSFVIILQNMLMVIFIKRKLKINTTIFNTGYLKKDFFK